MSPEISRRTVLNQTAIRRDEDRVFEPQQRPGALVTLSNRDRLTRDGRIRLLLKWNEVLLLEQRTLCDEPLISALSDAPHAKA